MRKFTEAGYGVAVPEVVFWNVRDSKAVPLGGLAEWGGARQAAPRRRQRHRPQGSHAEGPVAVLD